MSRSQKNVRLAQRAVAPPTSGNADSMPGEVTKKDGAANIAGTVDRFSTDDYRGTVRVTDENC